MKPAHRPLPSSRRNNCSQCQLLNAPITPTARALGAHTVNQVPRSVGCAPMTSNWRWWWLARRSVRGSVREATGELFSSSGNWGFMAFVVVTGHSVGARERRVKDAPIKRRRLEPTRALDSGGQDTVVGPPTSRGMQSDAEQALTRRDIARADAAVRAVRLSCRATQLRP